MSLEPFDLSDFLEGIKNDPYRRARGGDIEGHKLTVRFDRRSRYAICSCGWGAAANYYNRNGERRSTAAQHSDVVAPAYRHAVLAATRPELFAERRRAANG